MKRIRKKKTRVQRHWLPCLCVVILSLTSSAFASEILPWNSVLAKTKAPIASVDVVRVYDHDPEAFTQGLFYYRGFLYESKGLRGRSALQKKNLTGKVLSEQKLSDQFFAEGIALLNGKIYQLTYQGETGFIYDFGALNKTGQFFYQGEGWGLAAGDGRLWMSNGSARITVRHPETFRVERTITVTDGQSPVSGLNELEMVKGELWANVFTEDVLVRIDPQSGRVKGWIDLGPLRSYLPANARVDVLNGIAYDPETDRIFVTGKLWPKLFEIRLKL